MVYLFPVLPTVIVGHLESKLTHFPGLMVTTLFRGDSSKDVHTPPRPSIMQRPCECEQAFLRGCF